jgi:diaminohydroxyphosphoribosylaminopyrimidine deaminase/5-amino-6-(5-phosphoribosylamino)uracil reductase
MSELEDELHMREAVGLARRGRGRVSPNPMVGAVLTKGGRVISRGYHKKFGGPHAEVEALEGVEEDLAQSTLYVTLEPCCHHGKTPPCTDLILRRRVGRVVVGGLDPNPQVSGRGVRLLREGGAQVRVGVLESDCRALNRGFFFWMTRGRPFVTLKWAQSLDGRIATREGDSQWISSEPSRRRAHALRAEHDAVVVGAGTVLADDPRLTVRHVRGRNPSRVVLDSRLQTPPKAKVLHVSPREPAPWVVCATDAPEARADALAAAGARVMRLSREPQGGVDLSALLEEMGRAGISSVLVEGGSRVITSFLRERVAQRLVCFVAPVLLGTGVEAIGNLEVLRVEEGMRLLSWKIRRWGSDVMVDATLEGAE